ncbi:hypothetical protein Geob_1448 [Geotalea daltonii FRC-32]|uniref:Sulfotransferase n=1 Tax=Geotalea daltonii (strain DSM 22248 / JCM 15807 / FRC-32) TaxID=316067 RepID=B9M553_GEODF|nr:sulfotransferase [Geotalea daltonii]ACM19808.1 hypothetical protein Geob_1448 [Geotalea daltonii FRC-32]
MGLKLSLFRPESKPIEKSFVFITGTPRSGTSMLTKVIDAHPDAAILMENLFGNRRRHWERASFWNEPQLLQAEIEKVYSPFKQQLIGNKVCTPDVWSAEDIVTFCQFFSDSKFIFIVRDPIEVALSRFRRENYDKEFNSFARQHMQLDFRSRSFTYTSSWAGSIQNYWFLKELFPTKTLLIYYDDFCNTFEDHLHTLVDFLDLPFSEKMLKWHELPHHDSEGVLQVNLKYDDEPVFVNKSKSSSLTDELMLAMATIEPLYNRWKKRSL